MNPSSDATAALFALALALAAPAGAGASDAACALSVTSDPATLTMGRDGHARIRIATGAAAPQLAASIGRIDGLQAEGAGVFSARYVPPRQGYPQVAVVAARDGDACGWTTVRLVGVGEAVVRSRPRARIRLRIGERTFDPVTADGSGRAVVPIEVPPGVRYAYHGDQQIELGLPPSRHLAALPHPTSAPADEESSVDVLLVASTDDGAPRPGARVRWSASHGALSAPVPAGPGTFRARWTLPAGRAERATLSVALEGEDPTVVAVERPAGKPARLAVALDRARAVAGDPAPVGVQVTSVDATGNAADGDVAVSTTFGTAGAVERRAPGVYHANVVVPQELGGRSSLAIAAVAGAARGEASVELAPAAPAHMAVHTASHVVANGRDAAEVRVELTDRYGNPAPGDAPAGEAGAGAVGAARAEGPGRYVLAYTPRERLQDGSDVVRVTAGALVAARPVHLLAPGARIVLSPHVGLVLPTGGNAGLRAGVELAGWSRVAGQQLGVALDLARAALGGTERVNAPSGALTFDGDVGYVSLLASASWRRPLGPRSMAWLSAGGGAVRVASTVALSNQPAVPEVGWAPLASAAVAWGVRVGGGFPFLELRATWQGDPHVASVRGGFVPVSVSAGYRLGVL